MARAALPVARRIARLTARAKSGGVRAVSVNDALGRWRSVTHALELRHRSWFTAGIASKLREAGVSVCLMAPLKAFAVWFPTERQASMTGWVMVAGGTGALIATTPVEVALRHVDWRTLFVLFGAFTLLVAAWIAWRVPDIPPHAKPPAFREQWAGVTWVFSERRFWWIVPVAALGMGSFMAIQGLWSVPWMMEVEGRTRAEAATVLLAMNVLSLAGYLGLGLLSTRLAALGFHTRHMYLTGWTINLAAIVAIVMRLPGETFWWCAYGFGAAANIIAFTLLNETIPPSVAGRANTAVNLTMFGGSFAARAALSGSDSSSTAEMFASTESPRKIDVSCGR